MLIASVVFGENLVLDDTKNKEIVLDYMRKHESDPAPLCLNRECVEYIYSPSNSSVFIYLRTSSDQPAPLPE